MGVLYLLLSRDGTQVKIGITKSLVTLKTRLASLGGAALFNLESSRIFHCERARAVEQFLHFHFRHSHIAPSGAFVRDGTTECFSADVLSLACEFVVSNSAGKPLPLSELTASESVVARVAVPQFVDCSSHVSEYQNHAARLNRQSWNRQCFDALKHEMLKWEADSQVIGIYRTRKPSERDELRIAFRTLPRTDFSILKFYPNVDDRSMSAVFPGGFGFEGGAYLVLNDWLRFYPDEIFIRDSWRGSINDVDCVVQSRLLANPREDGFVGITRLVGCLPVLSDERATRLIRAHDGKRTRFRGNSEGRALAVCGAWA